MAIDPEEAKRRAAARSKRYREANKAELAAKRKQYRDANKVEIGARVKRWADANKPRRAAYRKQYLYNVDEYRWAAMWNDQNGLCAGCANPLEDSVQIDHDHRCCDENRSCGECVRGLLCGPCNRSIAQARHNPEILRQLAEYLESYPLKPKTQMIFVFEKESTT
jgi:hypothetical protein